MSDSMRRRLRPFFAALFGTLAIAAGAEGRGEERRTLTVTTRDLTTGAPAPGVSLTLRLPGDEKREATTGPDGVARFDYTLPASAGRRFFTLLARGEGLVPLYDRWNHEPKSPSPPDRIDLRTEKATRIGGRVVDEQGAPLADTVVVVNVNKSYEGLKQRVLVGGETVRTGADGRWSFTGVPERPDSVELAAYHYLCLTDHGSYELEAFKAVSALRDGTAVLRLRRGTRVEGTVLGHDGQPVGGAEVFYGEGQGYGNAIPPVKSDAAGRFTFGIKPGTITNLVARAPGFAPVIQEVKVRDGTLNVYLTLPKPHAVRGRVVDPEGKPVARASVRLFWNGDGTTARSYFGSAVSARATTDDAGRFEWKEAPAAGVSVSASAEGFVGVESQPVRSDQDQDLVLTRPTPVRGVVVDRETGRPVQGFSLLPAAAWQEASPLIWQRGWDLAREAKRTPDGFELTLNQTAYRYVLRVQADGYYAEESEPFPTDGKAHMLTFRLNRGDPVKGKVVNPDGSPAREGFVHVVPAHREGWIEYLSYPRDVSDSDRPGTDHAKVGHDGSFTLPPQRHNFALLALTETGSMYVSRDDLRGDDVLRLRPWGRVSGTVTTGRKPAAEVNLQSYVPEESAPVEGLPRMELRYWAKTDADGRFELPRVMPGRLTLAEWVPNGVNRRIWPVVRASLEVEGGRTHELKIGASGRVVTARLILPRSDVWMIRKAEIVSRDAKAGKPAPIGVELLDEGRIRALDLKPGDYTLRVALHEPPPGDACGWGRLLGEYQHEFTVPAGADPATPPLDLGTLEAVAEGGRPPAVGDAAPQLKIKTFDGHELTPADFKGKYVLLDFWASWCAPCLAEMPNLRRVQEEFGRDPRFVLVSVAVDERPADAERMIKSLKLSWLQASSGPDSPAVAAYGATAIPATFLIGPDGKILATDLRGDAARKSVADALKP